MNYFNHAENDSQNDSFFFIFKGPPGSVGPTGSTGERGQRGETGPQGVEGQQVVKKMIFFFFFFRQISKNNIISQCNRVQEASQVLPVLKELKATRARKV